MEKSKEWIVQYVGFKTELVETDFIKRWAPFASNFKTAGIKSINLYKVKANENITFISRNVWESKTYFDTFPTGVAGSGSGGGIKVVQFGGYYIDETDLQFPSTMNILFSNEDEELSFATMVRKQCSKNVDFLKMIEFSGAPSSNVMNRCLVCMQIKTM